MRWATLSILCGLLALSACENRTYVVVTVDVDPALRNTVRQIRFVSRVLSGDTVVSTDEQRFPDSAATVLEFPNSFVVIADGYGKRGSDTVEVFAEGIDGSSTVRGRARGTAPVVAGKETSLQITLTAPCATTEDCLGGGAFCDAPARCECEGEDCLEGFCIAIALDDGNPCTTADCNEAAQIVAQVPADDGTSCGTNDDGLAVSCVGGVCGCGDGITNADVEQCDQGAANADSPNRCRLTPACTIPYCGDGIVDDGVPFFEECDNGAANSDSEPDACRTNCRLAHCGDDVDDTGEECDDGVDNDDVQPLACRTDCRAPHCGDGVVDVGPFRGMVFEEECDDGAANSNTDADACRQTVTLENGTGATVECKVAFCGDDVLDTGERCDDNNSVNGDGCNPTCNLFGDVALLAGSPGGPGNADGAGSDARVRDVVSLSFAGGVGYFVTNEEHTSSKDHTVRSLDVATGAIATLAGFPGSPGDTDGIGSEARLRGPRGIAAVGSDAYIADTGNHRIKRLNPATNEVTTIGGTGAEGYSNGDLAAAQFAAPTFITARSATELIVYDKSSSVGCRLRLIDLTAGTVSLLAGDTVCIFAFDGSGSGAWFGEVSGIAMGPEPYVYVADSSKIRRVNLSASPAVVDTVAGSSEGTIVDAVGTSARFGQLGGIVAGSSNDLYISDRGNNAIRHLNLSTNEVTTVGDPGSLTQPLAIALDGTDLVVSEATRHTLNVASTATVPLSFSVLAGLSGTSGAADGDGLDALFDTPAGVCMGTSAGTLDHLYVADSDNGTVRSIDLGTAGNPVSTLSTSYIDSHHVASDAGRLFATFVDGASDQFLQELDPVTGASTGIGAVDVNSSNARGVAVLGDYAYIAGAASGTIRRVNLTTGADELFTGQNGTPGIGDGDISVARFSYPYAIVACGGDLYVADSAFSFASHTVRKIDMTTLTVSTLAGTPTAPGADDGVGSAARFSFPEAIACDGTSLYVADRNSHLIRQIELASGRVSTLAGVPFEAGSIDGVGINARFNAPRGITYDPTTGDLFVTDEQENVVRRIQ